MDSHRRHLRRSPSPRATAAATSRGPVRGNDDEGDARRLMDADWQAWLRAVERKRRVASRLNGSPALPDVYVARETYTSFRLEGLGVTEVEVNAALHDRRADRALRTRQSQRLRNHAAILIQIEAALRHGEPLRAGGVVRWYTLVSCGLSTSALGAAAMGRIDAVARRINSPRLRLHPAVREVARLHAQVIADPLVPSFNGILARLLLRYHLGRCGLPPVVFDPSTPAASFADDTALLVRLLSAIDTTYDAMLSKRT